MSKYNSRKLLVGFTILAVGIAVAIIKGDIPEHLLQLLEVVFGGFIVGNSVSHLANSRKSPEFEEPRPEPEPLQMKQSEPAQTKQSEVDLVPLMQGIITVQQMLELIIRKTGIDRMPDPK